MKTHGKYVELQRLPPQDYRGFRGFLHLQTFPSKKQAGEAGSRLRAGGRSGIPAQQAAYKAPRATKSWHQALGVPNDENRLAAVCEALE